MAIRLKKFLKSFTLIELIIVIAIIAVLGASAFLVLSQWMSKGRDSRRISDLRTLEKTIHISFVSKEGADYPDPDPKVGITVGTGIDSYGILWYQGKFGEKMTDYVGNLTKIPKDPKGNYYDYSLTEDKKYYQLLAIMENDKEVSMGIGKVYGDELERTYILTNYEGYIIKKIGADKYYLIKTETIMVDPTKLEDYSEQEYEMDVKNDLLKADAPYSERVEVLTGDISGLLSEDADEQQAAMDIIEEIFPELNNTPIVEEIIQQVGASSNIQVNNTNECTAHEYSGYNFDIILHGESQTKTRTESITDGTKTFELTATCNNGVVTYGEEQSSIECTNDKVLSSGSCVSDICQGNMPDNAQLNGTQSVSGTWGYSETSGLCKFKCIEGYNFDNGTSCELNTYTVSGSFGDNANGATINVCGSNVTADSNGDFSRTLVSYGTNCSNITATRSGYTCSTTTDGPASLASNSINIAGNCNEIVNGVCNNTVRGGCESGNLSWINNDENCGTTATWSCNGIYGGTTASCSFVNGTCVTYSWESSEWSTCSKSCGGGTQSRTVICKSSLGATVADSFCTTTKPAISQSCNTGTCNYTVSFRVGSIYSTKVWYSNENGEQITHIGLGQNWLTRSNSTNNQYEYVLIEKISPPSGEYDSTYVGYLVNGLAKPTSGIKYIGISNTWTHTMNGYNMLGTSNLPIGFYLVKIKVY